MDTMALAMLNQSCRETGVCPTEEMPDVKHAAELYKDGSKKVIRVACWSDGKVTSCVLEKGEDGKVKEEVCCYTAEDGGMELAMAWEAHLTSPEVGYKIRTIEVVQETVAGTPAPDVAVS